MKQNHNLLVTGLSLVLVLTLLAGSVQGQMRVDTFYNGPIGDSGLSYPECQYECVWPDDERLSSPYWTFHEYDAICAYDGMVYGSLCRRLDRWYLDTVQVCDTLDITGEALPWDCGPYPADLSGYKYLAVRCRDTTIYAKRVKKTKTEWVIPE